MGWIEPKTDWNPGDGIKASDLNRIEDNTDELLRMLMRSVSLGNYREVYFTNTSPVRNVDDLLIFDVGVLDIPDADTDVVISANCVLRDEEPKLIPFLAVIRQHTSGAGYSLGSYLHDIFDGMYYTKKGDLESNGRIAYYREFEQNPINHSINYKTAIDWQGGEWSRYHYVMIGLRLTQSLTTLFPPSPATVRAHLKAIFTSVRRDA